MLKRSYHAKASGENPFPRDPRVWLGFYRSLGKTMETGQGIIPISPETEPFLHFLNAVMRLFQLEKAEDSEVEAVIEEVLSRYLDVLGLTLVDEGQVSEDSPDEELPEVYRIPFLALWFWMRVAIPCFLQFQTTPARLLARARRGDLEAIRNLLLIDDMAIQDSEVARHVYAHKDGPSLVAQALPSAPRAASDDQWKARAAAGIRRIAQELAQPLTHQDIVDLFHALAKDCDGSERGDESLAFVELTSFSRKVNREDKFWDDKA